VRRTALVSVAVTAVLGAGLAFAGCGGSSSAASSQQAQRRPLTPTDLIGILPTPNTPDGANYELNDYSSTLTLAQYRQAATTAADRALARTLGRAGLTRVYQRSFNGAINQADASVFLFRNAAGAGTGFRRLRSQLRRPGSVGQKVAEIPVTGLGPQAWAGHLTGAGSDSGIVVWRNGNVIVVTDMQCDDKCDFDVVKAVRAYATQIDDLVNESAKSS